MENYKRPPKRNGGILTEYHAGKVKALNELYNFLINDYDRCITHKTSSRNIIASKIIKYSRAKYIKGLISKIDRKLEILYNGKDTI